MRQRESVEESEGGDRKSGGEREGWTGEGKSSTRTEWRKGKKGGDGSVEKEERGRRRLVARDLKWHSSNTSS